VDQLEVMFAALDALSLRWSERFTVVAFPDEIEREAPAIDLLVAGASGEMAIEHTLVESFPQRIFDDRLFVALAAEVERRLTNELPMPGHYRVVLKPGEIRRRQDIEGVAAAIVDWARTSAPDLQIGDPTSAPSHIAEGILAPSGLRVRLERWPGRDGQVLAIRSVPEDLTEQRRERVATAMDRKLPKLAKASEGQCRSLLVLESDDLALGNYVEIASAATVAIEERKDVPDVICLVETELGADVWLVKEFSEVFPHVPSPGPLPR
jgi:hypothetical protein